MAAKSRPGRVEIDIEKYRGEANWPRVLDLSRQLSTKTANHENLVKFLQVECRIERSLTDHPPTDDNVDETKAKMRPEMSILQELLTSNPQTSMKQEILLLMGKLHYVMGEYDDAINKFHDLQLDSLSLGEASSRKLKLIGEAFAIKGLCLEKMPPASTSRYRQAEREQKIIECFEKSGDISLVQLQERLEKGSSKLGAAGTAAAAGTASSTAAGGAIWATAVDTDTVGVGPIVETAIQRSPILYIRSGELNKCIGRFRELLRAVETRAVQGLRQTLARQLAEVLLRGVCENSYVPIDLHEPRDTSASSTLKPKKYRGDGLFVPKNGMEEALLLLLISESIATRDAVLNRSPDLTDARLHTFHNTTAVYDLLTMALVKRAQFTMLSETFERAMRFSFDEFHIWYQFALSLICSEKYSRAYVVLKECMRLNPENPIVYLQATKLAYEFLGLTDEGIEFCEKLIEQSRSSPHLPRAYLMLGIGYSMKGNEVLLQAQRQIFQCKAVNAFDMAVELDPNDYLAHFHLALQMALRRQIGEAIKEVRQAIHLHSDHHNSHHLLALLLSAQKQYSEALLVIEASLSEYPQSFSMLFTKCKLLTQVSTYEAALQTCRNMLQLWKDLYETALESESRGTGLLERITTDHRSLLHLQLEVSDRDSGSVRVESAAASKLEHALSEVVSSVASGFQTKSGRQQTWTLQMQIWLLLAELYLNMERIDSANACIQEASCLFPVSHVVSYMRGRYHQAKNELLEAKRCYENAIAINPSHNKSLYRLGMVQHMLGNSRLAEKVLRDAITYEPTSSQCWQTLGKVLDSLGDHEVATECLMTAAELEATSPIVPFSSIPKVLI